VCHRNIGILDAKARSHVATLMKSKRNEMATLNNIQAQIKEIYFIFNLECGMSLYQEGYNMDCQ
jgi:hypothetical protein